MTLNVIGDKLLASQTSDVKEGVAQIKWAVGKDWGAGAYLVATLRRPLDAPAQRPNRQRAILLYGARLSRIAATRDGPQLLVMRCVHAAVRAGAACTRT